MYGKITHNIHSYFIHNFAGKLLEIDKNLQKICGYYKIVKDMTKIAPKISLTNVEDCHIIEISYRYRGYLIVSAPVQKCRGIFA